MFVGFCGGWLLPLLWFNDSDLVPWINWAEATFFRRVFILTPVSLLLSGIGLVISYGLLAFPLFWLTEAPQMPKRMRLLAFCLLVLGVHFSLLAS
jgi:hypothetical protein